MVQWGKTERQNNWKVPSKNSKHWLDGLLSVGCCWSRRLSSSVNNSLINENDSLQLKKIAIMLKTFQGIKQNRKKRYTKKKQQLWNVKLSTCHFFCCFLCKRYPLYRYIIIDLYLVLLTDSWLQYSILLYRQHTYIMFLLWLTELWILNG